MRTLVKNCVRTEFLDFTEDSRRSCLTINENLLWWSEKTKEEDHMLTLSIDEIKNTLLMAIFAFNEDDNQLIAAAGIFIPRTWNDSRPYFNTKMVVEIGTNFVLPVYRNQGIGAQLIEERLNYAKAKNWIPVSISSNEIVHKSFVKLNGSLMEDDPDCEELIKLLCLRCPNGESCKCCPIIPGCGWIFK
ncbi:MAG: GNAT family N-acetyltransferase [Chitinophagaceae bacterium]|nr:GNAT family N-acetyltransferase [Chitinophagaceae bacterium]